MRFTHICATLALSAIFAITGCKKEPTTPTAGTEGAGGAGGAAKKTIVIGMVAKSQSNDVFVAAHSGADAAAKELGAKRGVTVTIDWRTPVSEDAAKQVEAIEALTRSNADAIIVSCTNAETLTPAINRAVEKGVPVMCFDSDAPSSKRFAFYGTDDVPCGASIMAELCKAMGDQGTVAILAGNQSAPNLQNRVKGAQEEMAKHPNVKLLPASGGIFYHEETPEKAAETVSTVTNANPSITGWCMVGGWPLFTTNALKWEPGKIKVTSADALPAQLSYVKTGYVAALLAQDCYGWGSKSVDVVLNKVIDKKDPPSPRIIDPLTKVTKENVDEYGKNWEKWLGK
jgi:ribose transport system substrate-binding protein